jgi:hypothetical protein
MRAAAPIRCGATARRRLIPSNAVTSTTLFCAKLGDRQKGGSYAKPGFIAFELEDGNVVLIALQEVARFEPKAIQIGTDADSLNGDGRPFA